MEHQRGLRAEGRARVAEVGNASTMERAPQLRAGRHRPPLRPDRGVDGVRSRRSEVRAVGLGERRPPSTPKPTFGRRSARRTLQNVDLGVKGRLTSIQNLGSATAVTSIDVSQAKCEKTPAKS